MYVGYVGMATASNSEKIIGGIGIAAAVVFIIAMLIAIVNTDGFTFGSGTLSGLFPENVIIVAGSVIAGILGALFGLLITLGKAESKVFIGKIRGILMVLSGAVLVVLGMTNGNELAVYLFIALIILSAASDTFYNWVSDQKIFMVFSLFLMLFIALTGILSQTGENSVMGFAFAAFVAFWVILVAAIRFIPIVEAEPLKKEKKGKESETKKKNAPAPRPYPVKKEEPKKAAERPAEKAKKPKEEPKKAEPPVQETEEKPPAEAPKPAEAKAKEPIKVMSSREAAAARNARKKEEPAAEAAAAEVEVEAVAEAEAEVAPEPPAETVPEEADTETFADAEEEGFDENLEIMEDTPDALLRRATWNKGLRCRRDYGEYLIPIAYVKAKVAVYVQTEAGADDASVDEKLMAKGWTVFRYKESDITDGKDQAEEISKAVKENLRADRAKKKKSSKK